MTFGKKIYGGYFLIVCVLVIGLGASGWLAWKQQEAAERNTVEEFMTAARDRLRLVRDKLEHNNVILRSVEAFFLSSDDVTREEFAIFSLQLLKDYAYIQAVEWLPEVSNADRAAFEKRAAYPGFSITETDPEKDMVPAAVRDVYTPIYYAEPLDKNRRIIGFDAASDPARREALTRAHDTGRLAVTGRTTLLQNREGNAAAVIFYQPVFGKQIEASGVSAGRMGFVASVVPLDAMIAAALAPLDYKGVNFVIHDLSSAQGESDLLYVRSTRLKKIPAEEIVEDYARLGSLTEAETLDVGGRKWRITIMPARGYFKMGIQTEVCLIFLAGGFFTCFLAYYIFGRLRESEKIGREVEERTRQLAKAQKETETILLSTLDGVTGLDAAGNITFCNPMAGLLLGYDKNELIGQNHHALLHHSHADKSGYVGKQCPISQVLEYGRSCSVSDEVFWTKTGEAVQIEYTGSPIFEGDRIIGAVLVFRDIAERRALEKQLEQMARYDQLTGLANRALFDECLKRALAQAETTEKTVGLIYCDLNDFKVTNDTLGHAAGDDLLKEFAACLRAAARPGDIPARLGGDEFVLLVDNLDSQDECLRLIEALREKLGVPVHIGGRSMMISASIGVAFSPEHADAPESLMLCADQAMYQAKKDKRLPFAVYAPAVIRDIGTR